MATIGAVGNTDNNNFRQQNNVEAFERQNATREGGNKPNAAVERNTNNEGNRILAPPETTEIEVEGIRTVTENNIERQTENLNNNNTNNTAQQNNARQTQRGTNVDINV